LISSVKTSSGVFQFKVWRGAASRWCFHCCRSPLCGRTVYGHTVVPLANEIDAVGGIVSKSAYAGLWGYALENNLVVSETDWADNIGARWFVDVSDSQFRVPDLRNYFLRFTGTVAGSGNVRGLGSLKISRHIIIRSNPIVRNNNDDNPWGNSYGKIGQYVATGNVYSTAPAGHVAVAVGDAWITREDHRSESLYLASTGEPYALKTTIMLDAQPVRYTGLGEIPDWLTLQAPVFQEERDGAGGTVSPSNGP